jgi:AmmeMemoRadiSam system protein B/AmmeMemoRadiSam system protein A
MMVEPAMLKILLVISLVGMCAMCAGKVSTAVREPAVAGQFYPSDPRELAAMVSGQLAKVSGLPTIDGRIIALIVPHAGLVYSGPIAAYGYKLLENSGVKKVILCGPSHRIPFRGLSVYGPDITWRTPLGMVPCDNDLCRAFLARDAGFDTIPEAQAYEHCLEVQLPYLQTVLKDFRIVPIIMGNQDHQTITHLADALAAVPFDSQTVMISATDWQHYRPASEGYRLDSAGIDCIEHLDADRLQTYLDNGRTEACGGGPTVAVIRAAVARGANKAIILKYGDSGDMSGDRSSVVGYVAAVLYKSGNAHQVIDPEAKKAEASPATGPSAAEKKTLIGIARKTIEAQLAGGPGPKFEGLTEYLKQPGAAFVTLEKHGRLRGCIGLTAAMQPLYETVAYCALQAAFSDPRFDPVTADEMPDIRIEISILTPLQRVKSLDEIQVGRDGLMISKGMYRGLLLPQVATEYGWDRETFLRETCQKAGLPDDAYLSKDALIQKFQAIVFNEEE